MRRTFVIHLAVTVDVGLPDHLVDLFVGQLLAEVRHDMAKFGGGNETVAVLRKQRYKGVGVDATETCHFIQLRLTLSNTLNASLISSSESVSFIFLAIIVKNSGKSMVPLPNKSNILVSTFRGTTPCRAKRTYRRRRPR